MYRSAISAYHAEIEGGKIGAHPIIKSLMAGIFNLRMPRPRYKVIWDVDQVLEILRKTPKNEDISLKMLTYKTAMVIALVTAGRCSELKYMNTDMMANNENKYIFYFDTPLKQTRGRKTPKPLEIYRFEKEESICPVNLLGTYIKRTDQYRNNNQNKQLFISIIKPHKPVSNTTIACWIKQILKMTGIDTTIFKGHSSRAASTSKVASKGACLKDILQRGHWSSNSVWQRFYNKDIENATQRFQKALMG